MLSVATDARERLAGPTGLPCCVHVSVWCAHEVTACDWVSHYVQRGLLNLLYCSCLFWWHAPITCDAGTATDLLQPHTRLCPTTQKNY